MRRNSNGPPYAYTLCTCMQHALHAFGTHSSATQHTTRCSMRACAPLCSALTLSVGRDVPAGEGFDQVEHGLGAGAVLRDTHHARGHVGMSGGDQDQPLREARSGLWGSGRGQARTTVLQGMQAMISRHC